MKRRKRPKVECPPGVEPFAPFDPPRPGERVFRIDNPPYRTILFRPGSGGSVMHEPDDFYGNAARAAGKEASA